MIVQTRERLTQSPHALGVSRQEDSSVGEPQRPEMLEQDVVVKLPPKHEYLTVVEVTSVSRGKVKIVAPDDDSEDI